MLNPIYSDVTAFFNQLLENYQKQNRDYCVHWSIPDRIQHDKPNVNADFQYIYEQIALFPPLYNALYQAISKYQQDKSLFKSKKEINAFILSLQRYYLFFEDILNNFSKKLASLDLMIGLCRIQIAGLTEINELLSVPENERQVEITIQAMRRLIQQKPSIYAFAKMTLLSYEMLSDVFKICQMVKNEKITLPQQQFNHIDNWMVKYEKERITELQVTTSLGALNVAEFEKQVANLINDNHNQSRRTPLGRYTLANRIQAFMPPPKPPAPTPQNNAFPSIEAAAKAYRKSVLQLREKVDQLNEEGSNNENYHRVAQTAEVLIGHLEKLQEFFQDPRTVTKDRVNQFVDVCNLAISKAYKDFGEHRSFLGQLNPFLKCILGVLAAMTIIMALVVEVKSKHGFVGTFFRKHNTDSLDKLNAFTTETEATMRTLSNAM